MCIYCKFALLYIFIKDIKLNIIDCTKLQNVSQDYAAYNCVLFLQINILNLLVVSVIITKFIHNFYSIFCRKLHAIELSDNVQ